MQAKLDQQIASFVTQTKDEQGAPPLLLSISIQMEIIVLNKILTQLRHGACFKKKDMVTVNGKDYHWCTGDHYSGGEKHNKIYADHKSSKHRENV